jgi:hypothetical protein
MHPLTKFNGNCISKKHFHAVLKESPVTFKVPVSLKNSSTKPSPYTKNTGDTIVRQAIIPGKNFCYPCKSYYPCLPTGIKTGNEWGGDAFV